MSVSTGSRSEEAARGLREIVVERRSLRLRACAIGELKRLGARDPAVNAGVAEPARPGCAASRMS
jgi:hypothetical protein